MACNHDFIINQCMPTGNVCPLGEPDVMAMPVDSDDGETYRVSHVQRGDRGLTKEVLSVTSDHSSKKDSDSDQDPEEKIASPNYSPINPLWSLFTSIVHGMIQSFVVTLAVNAARRPKACISLVGLLSLTLISVGFFTNFNINTNEQVIYAPFKSRTASHTKWKEEESGFPEKARLFSVNLHNDGDNIFTADNIRKVFSVLDEVRSHPGYDDLCARGDYVNYFDGQRTCKIMSVTRFFQHNVDVFDQIYAEGGEEAIIRTVSAETYENGAPVDTSMILGKIVRDNSTNLIVSAELFNVFFLLPDIDGVVDLEDSLLESMPPVQKEWNSEDSTLKMEYFCLRSYSNEFRRAIEEDLYLLPVAFFLMSGFTCLVFLKCDRVQSRTSLGVGAVVTIVCSLMTGFGIMFCFGVPFTSMTQILPFVVFGVGLDDTFIITSAYFRTDPDKDIEERVRETFQEIGMSISVTTITTMFAFMLGCSSTIPAIYWLNLYAFPTIAIDFLYQITFFVALVVLDERRIQSNRMDCCICVSVARKDSFDCEDVQPERVQRKALPERFMKWYGDKLLRPWMKLLVIVAFLAYAGCMAYSTTLLTQEFNLSDLLPADSYVKDFIYAMESYSYRLLGVGIYFRGDFDQMDPDIQEQMNAFIDDISALPQFADSPPFCWFRDFEKFMETDLAQDFADDLGISFENMTNKELLDFAFSIPAIQETYSKHVVRDEEGRITASRCYTYANSDLTVVKDQIQTLKDQEAVSARQPINQGKDDWAFFTLDSIYFLWEFYAVAVEELTFTTISGVAAVCGVGFFFFPHWRAILFVFPLISMLYINLLGTLQYAGIHINAVTYICLVVSIGLMVDFLVHVLLRYYESPGKTRDEKVKDTLETMGASILVGGISTTLGVLPLSLSTSSVLQTVFTCFFAMIALGVTHGLVFLPVVLSLCGPLYSGNFSSPVIDCPSELALKEAAESDTDESDSYDEAAIKTMATPENSIIATPSFIASPKRYAEVLESVGTCTDESMEVLRWNPDRMSMF